MDPEDRSTNITLNLKKSVEFEVYTVNKKASGPRLVIDVRDVSRHHRKRRRSKK